MEVYHCCFGWNVYRFGLDLHWWLMEIQSPFHKTVLLNWHKDASDCSCDGVNVQEWSVEPKEAGRVPLQLHLHVAQTVHHWAVMLAHHWLFQFWHNLPRRLRDVIALGWPQLLFCPFIGYTKTTRWCNSLDWVLWKGLKLLNASCRCIFSMFGKRMTSYVDDTFEL